MANQLGALIGVVWHTFKTSISETESVTIKLGFDFTHASDDDVKSWLVSNRVIAFQRPARALGASELKALDGTVMAVSNVGKKIESKSKRIDALVKIGIPQNLAEIAVDNPTAFNAIMAKINASPTETENE